MVYFNEIIRIFGLRLFYRQIIRNIIFKQDVTWFMRLLYRQIIRFNVIRFKKDVTWFILMRLLESLVYFINK